MSVWQFQPGLKDHETWKPETWHPSQEEPRGIQWHGTCSLF